MNYDLNAYDRAMEALYEKHKSQLVDVPEGESGPWKVEKFTVEKGIYALRLHFQGRSCPPGQYTRLCKSGTGIFMSDTPAEYMDLRPLRGVFGDLLVSGLGLGMTLKALLPLKLNSITVIENDADVIKLVWPTYENDPAYSNVRVIEGDAFTWKPDMGFDWAWHDIWPEISEDNLPEFAKLRRHYGRYMSGHNRQLCWGEPEIRRMQRDYRYW